MWAVVQPWWSFRPTSSPWRRRSREISTISRRLSGRFALWTILLGTIAPFGLSIAALRHLAATRLGITLTLEPVVATFIAWAWLDETLATPQLIGGAVVLDGHPPRPNGSLTSK